MWFRVLFLVQEVDEWKSIKEGAALVFLIHKKVNAGIMVMDKQILAIVVFVLLG